MGDVHHVSAWSSLRILFEDGYLRVPGGSKPIGQVIALESTDRGEFGWFPITRACKTDDHGGFRAPALKGSYKIWAAQAHDSGPDDRGPSVSDVPPSPRAFMPQVVEFRPRRLSALPLNSLYLTVAIRGTITDPDGKPAPGVAVMFMAAIGSAQEKRLTTLQWTTTNAEGHYVLTGIPRGLTRAFLNVYAEPPDRRSHSQEILDGIFEALFVVSGGHTLAGTVRGAYRMKDGTKQTDVLEQVWVAYEEADRLALRELVAGFCSLLGQESMYLELTDSIIELIPPREEG